MCDESRARDLDHRGSLKEARSDLSKSSENYEKQTYPAQHVINMLLFQARFIYFFSQLVGLTSPPNAVRHTVTKQQQYAD